jgi:hypothetical protein
VDKYPLAEAEYRAVLARIWDSSHGKLLIADSTSLELLRLQLGISLEKAQELERDIRTQLAEEAFRAINIEDIIFGRWMGHDQGLLARAIRFDALTALRLLLQHLRSNVSRDIESRRVWYLRESGVWPDTEEYDRFSQFLTDLVAAMNERRNSEVTGSSPVPGTSLRER